jgi:NAD(P)-dependent dehydrogenase (short-subunit alcohol dehydrogenase family)
MPTKDMTIEGTAVLVTGANRGIGRALVEEALGRGAARVYAGTRQPLTHPDRRVTPLTLDVTSTEEIQAAAERVEALDILINNAGVAVYDDLGDREALERHLAVNLFGTYGVTQAFVPALQRSGGAIVNVVSLSGLAAVPMMPSYSVSKAAAFSLSQALRARLAGRGVSVHAVMAGPVDTDMSRPLEIPKASPESVAQAILDGSRAERRRSSRTSRPPPSRTAGAPVRRRRWRSSSPRWRRQRPPRRRRAGARSARQPACRCSTRARRLSWSSAQAGQPRRWAARPGMSWAASPARTSRST